MFALRGAITVERNDAALIEAAGAELLRALVERNRLAPERLVSALFTSTPDLDAGFPATGARQAGFAHVPMIGAQEIGVPGAEPRIVRVLLHVDGRPDGAPQHVYLGDAARLRPDLAGG